MNKKIMIIIGVILIMGVIGAALIFATSPNPNDYTTCPKCGHNSTYVTATDSYFNYYCENCDIVYTVTKSEVNNAHQYYISEKGSSHYNVIVDYMNARKDAQEAVDNYKKATGN